MRRKLSYAVVAAVLAALAFSNPVVAEAARTITSGDIRNDTIRSKDVKDNTLRSRDIRNNTVRSKDVHDGSLTDADLAPGAGRASAYARVIATPALASLDTGRSKAVTSVTRTADGVYCLELATGVNREVAVVSSPVGALANASAQWTNNCGTNGVQITTERLVIGPGGAALNDVAANDVSFHVIVP